MVAAWSLSLLARWRRARVARQWAELAGAAGRLPLSILRPLRDEAVGLRGDLDRFLTKAGPRLDGLAAPQDLAGLPAGTDWRARPRFLTEPISPSGIAGAASGTQFCDGASLWHNAPPGDPVILRQVVNDRSDDLTPYGLQLETFGFSGSFLSVSVDLDREALAGLSRSNILRLDMALTLERPLSIYARMNIGHGPNVDEIQRHIGNLPAGENQRLMTEFDLYLVDMNETRLEKLWLDIILEQPATSRVVLHDVFLSRHLRAEL